MLRQTVALALALMLCPFALADARCIVQAGGVAALTDADGRELLSGEGIEALFEVRPGALYAAGRPGDYALYDANGAPVGDQRFSMIDDAGGALLFRRGDHYGAMDEYGRVLIEPVWTRLACDGECFLALEGDPLDEQPDELLRVDEAGGAEGTGVYIDGLFHPFREGRLVYRGIDGRYGCLDGRGRPVIGEAWAWMGDFENSAAIVSDGTRRGLIGPDGEALVPLRYIWLQRFGDGFLGLTADNTAEVLSGDGQLLGQIEAPSGELATAGDFWALRDDAGWTLFDRDGQALTTAGEGAVFLPGLQGQCILSDGAWGAACQRIVTASGSFGSEGFQCLLPLNARRYAFLTFDEGDRNVRWGILSPEGTVVAPAEYREILPCGDHRLILLTRDSVILADDDGNDIRQWPRRDDP